MKSNCPLFILGLWYSGWLLLLLTRPSAAQTLPPATGTKPGDYTGTVSLDRLGNIYLADRQNNLHQFNAVGERVATYSPPAAGRLALIEAWNVARILLFYDDQQQIVLLDRFLAPITTTRLSNHVDGLVKIASLAADNKVWAFNESNFSLHKLDLQYPEASRTVPLDLVLNKNQYDIRFLREYQNQVYLIDKNSGIYVFDNLGNYQKKLPFTGLSYVGFRGDELYYLINQKIHFFHLYTLQERIIDLSDLAGNVETQQVLVGENRMYLLSARDLRVVPLK